VHRYIKAVGAGARRARDLTSDEARAAMALVSDGAEPVQVGAFLLALRMKGESADELSGFIEALHAHTARAAAPAGTVDVDCHGDGHAGRATLLPAAACAAAALGVPVALRCDLQNGYARHGLAAALGALGLDLARPLTPARAARALAAGRLAVVDLQPTCPPLARLLALRPLLGVRTVAQTLSKLLDPLSASARVVGVFHSPFLPSTATALARVSPARGLAVQALGGLPEARPGKLVRVAYANAPEPVPLDLRSLAGAPDLTEPGSAPSADNEDGPDASDAAVRENRAALDGEEPHALAAAATCALLLHAARGTPILDAVAEARQALADGRAKAAALAFASA
jgi:anthranilate phosphoribosyltransferase